MNKQTYITEFITEMVRGSRDPAITATMIVERLKDEGFLQLGYGDNNVDVIIITFKEVFNTTKTSKLDRYAAARMANKYGVQAVVGVIKLLGTRADDQYCPVVGSVRQLEEKWVNIISYLRKSAPEKPVDE